MGKMIASTLHNLSPVPKGAVWRGAGVFEFTVKEDPYNIDKKVAEFDDVKLTYFKDKSFKTALTMDAVVAEKEKKEPVTKTDTLITAKVAK